jgi:hypothetical protein
MRRLMSEPKLQWTQIRERKPTVPEHVVWRGFATETVLLNINTGIYHGLDDVSGRFFEVVRASADLAAAVESLAAEYEQSSERIAEDMLRFCNELRELGLIEFSA